MEGMNAIFVIKANPDMCIARPLPDAKQVRKAYDEGTQQPNMVKPVTLDELRKNQDLSLGPPGELGNFEPFKQPNSQEDPLNGKGFMFKRK